MPGANIDTLPTFREGDPISATEFQKLIDALRRQTLAPGSFQTGAFSVQRPMGLGDSTTTDVDIKIVLIDDDIPGIDEYAPSDLLVAADVPLTADEILAGYTVVLQDPPDPDYATHHVDSLNRWGYKRRQVSLKYFTGDPTPNAGAAQAGSTSTTIKLALSASTVTGFYKGDTAATTSGTGSGQTRTITAYNGTTRVATVDSAWGTTPVGPADTHYEITSALDKVLAITIIDDPDHMTGETPAPRKIVRYATIEVWYDDGKPIKVGKYDRADYPDYGESDPWPPTLVDEPDTFFKKRLRGIVINGVLIRELCKELPPPPLPES